MDKSPDPNPVVSDTPIAHSSQDIMPADGSVTTTGHQRRNSYRGKAVTVETHPLQKDSYLTISRSLRQLSFCVEVNGTECSVRQI